MEIVWMLLFMIAVGAIIGGVTNSLAIKMLFRPYRALYVGKFRVPFTPGLIPKRRDELAKQMGKMVVDHLLTPIGIKKKFQDPLFKNEIVSWVQKEGEQFLSSKKTTKELAEQFFGEQVDRKVEAFVLDYVEKKYEEKMEQIRGKRIVEVLPAGVMMRINEKVDGLAPYLVEKVIAFFESEDGKQKLKAMIDDFLATRGTLGNMIQMFLGNTNLVSKVQPEVIKFLKNEGTRKLIANLLEQEWDKLKEYDMEKVEALIGKEEIVLLLRRVIEQNLPIKSFGEKTIGELVEPYRENIISIQVPKLVDMASQFLVDRIEEMMKKLHLAEVVREQVETFSVSRLEDMVLSISRREFKMITYLGALLGGLVGLIQGAIVLYLQM